MADDRTPHQHVCACGTRWTCSKPDCHISDECTRCDIEHFEEWAEANALTVYQPTLEPVEALLAKEDQ